MSWPLIIDAASVQRNTTVAATSSAATNRPVGLSADRTLRTLSAPRLNLGTDRGLSRPPRQFSGAAVQPVSRGRQIAPARGTEGESIALLYFPSVSLRR